MAVVVMSLGCEPGLVAAVRSVLSQHPAPEVVVVNSGGGDPGRALRAAGLGDVPVVHREERLNPGAARNLGIAATRAPFVAFLAADCIAEDGWVAGRLRAHREGADTVSSLLTNAYPGSRVAAASALLLHHRRMAHAPDRQRLQNGLSYDRRLLDEAGPFREDLRTGEDSEYKQRLNGRPIALPPAVVTAHRYPRRAGELLIEQYLRGMRQKRARRAIGADVWSGRLAVSMLSDAFRALWWTRAIDDRSRRRHVRRGWPLMPLAALAYAAGVLSAAAVSR